MQLRDGPRQVVAALAASGVFLALHFAANIVWWLALVLAVAAYAAFLLIIGRKRLLDEIKLSDRVTAADIEKAAASLQNAGERLAQAAETAPDADQPVIAEMSANVLSIRERILEDPEDYRPARRFVGFFLPRIVQSVELYVSLARKAGSDATDRVEKLGQEIRGFSPVIERINAACIENDLRQLEVEVEVLSGTLNRA